MINIYDEHKKDLKMLKKLFKSNKKIYNELFKNENCKYEEYIHNKITQEDFCKIILNSYEKLGINKESIDFYNKNLKSKNIIACCTGRQKTAYGFIWKYYNN